MKLTSLQRHIERQYEKPFKEILVMLYIHERLTIEQVANRLGVNPRTIQRWLKQSNIDTRKMIWV